MSFPYLRRAHVGLRFQHQGATRAGVVLAVALALVVSGPGSQAAPAKNSLTGSSASAPPPLRGSAKPGPSSPSAPKPSKTNSGVVTNASGDGLSVSQVHIGNFNKPYTDTYINTGENCAAGPTGGFGGSSIPICAYVTILPNGLLQPSSGNSQSDSIIDACGTTVASGTSYNWGANGFISSNWIGSAPVSIPTSGVCWGKWTLTYSFTQKFSDGATLTASNTATAWVEQGSAQVLSQNPQAAPTGGPVASNEQLGGCSCGLGVHASATAYPVDTASGNFWHTFHDVAIPGRGPALDLSRTYNSLSAGTDGLFGFGWTSSYSQALAVNGTTAVITVGSGAQATFTQSGTTWSAPPRVLAKLVQNADGTWRYTRNDGTASTFDAQGRLTALVDRNGYSTTITRPSATQMIITDPAGRALTLTLAGNHVANVSDGSSPARSITYSYDSSGNLTDVVDVGGGHWQFTYDASHRMLTMRSPRFYGNSSTSPTPVVTNHYDTAGRVDSQTDQLGRVTTFDYTSIANATKVTDPKGNLTVDEYTSGLLTAETHGYGTSLAATTYFRYDPGSLGRILTINADGYSSTATYDTAGNALTRTDQVGNTTTYTYNGFGEPTSITEPKTINGKAITRTLTYDANGNLLTTSAPLMDSTGAVTATATTTNHYADPAHPGDITSVTDPNNNTTTYTYDSFGDRTSTTDASGDKTTFGYDTGRGLRTSMVSARGNATGGTPSQFTTTYAYDPYGHLTSTKDPLWSSSAPALHQTTWSYDPDGNLASSTDGNGNTTSYSYDAAEQRTSLTRPNGMVLRTDYWPDGTVKDQIDGSGATTAYAYDSLAHLSTLTDPLGRKTTYGFDGIGHLVSKVTQAGSSPTYGFDPDGRPIATTYPQDTSGNTTIQTPNITDISYDADGQRISATTDPNGGSTPGTGTQTWTWDSLHRLISTKSAAGNAVTYGYDLAGNVTALTYPGTTGTVTRAYDAANRLKAVTDWNKNTSNFTYDADSNLVTTAYANGTTASASFDPSDNTSTIADAPTANPSNPFATFSYNRDGANQVTKTNATGVPADNHTYTYDANERLTGVDSGTYKYDTADNPTQRIDGTTQGFDAANQTTYTTSQPSITYVGSTAVGGTGTQALTLNYPAGTQVGDFVVLATTVAASKTITAPAGYTAYGPFLNGTAKSATEQLAVYTHFVTASDTSATLSYQGSTDKSATLAVYRNVHSANPVDYTNSNSTTSGTVLTPAPTNAQDPNDLGIFIGGADGTPGVWTPPAGMTGRSQTSGGATDISLADQPVTVLGTHPLPNATHTTASALVGVTIDLRAAQTKYGYDSDGQRTSISTPAGTTTNYAYDHAGRFSNSGAIGYDVDSLRIASTAGSATTNYTWDTSTTGTPLLLRDGTTNFIYGPGGRPLEQISGTTTNFFHQDQYGSTRALTDSGGTVVATYTYDPYGNLATHTGSVDTAMRWNGQYQDSSGFYYLRARYYDPQTAQFTTTDPLFDQTLARYVYGANNPLDRSDPSGRWFGLDDLAASTIGAVVGATTSIVEQAVTTGDVNWAKVGIAAGAGAAGGEATLYCGPFCGGAVAGGLNDIGNQLYDSGTINPVRAATATVLGGALGPLGEGWSRAGTVGVGVSLSISSDVFLDSFFGGPLSFNESGRPSSQACSGAPVVGATT